MSAAFPFDPDTGAEACRRLFDHFGIDPALRGAAQLEAVAGVFARIPYENLTKIIRRHESAASGARRTPGEVIAGHVRDGTGGTCFSLTAALWAVLDTLGWRVAPLLADRWYGDDTHCALLVEVDGAPCLIDPGYLIQRPVPLDVAAEARRPGVAGETVLRPVADGARIELWTERGASRSHRLTYKAQPADTGEFLRAWDSSFDWDMMRYPVLTRVDEGRHLYLQGQRFQVRDGEHTEREELAPEELAPLLARVFGIAPRVTLEALKILREQGELRDGTPHT